MIKILQVLRLIQASMMRKEGIFTRMSQDATGRHMIVKPGSTTDVMTRSGTVYTLQEGSLSEWSIRTHQEKSHREEIALVEILSMPRQNLEHQTPYSKIYRCI